MGMIAATFLLVMEEEETFWMMASVVEELLPASYFSPSLVGVQADQVRLRVLWIIYYELSYAASLPTANEARDLFPSIMRRIMSLISRRIYRTLYHYR